MANLGSALIYVRAVTDKLKGDLNKAEGDVDKSATGMNSSLKKINWAAVGAAAVAAAGVATAAIYKAIAAANEQEAAEARLEAVVKSTGKAAGFTADEMYGMAGALQRVTTVGDETTISGMAILSTFKNIRGEAFERTTASALDMAEVMQMDVRSSFVMLGKALNDPVSQLGQLSRSGITFTKEQKAMVKQLWESGQQLEAQRIILEELESQFGGAAAAARDTFGGAMLATKNVVGDMWEAVGFAITKNEDFIKTIKDVEQQLIEATPAITEFAKDAVELALGLIALNKWGNETYDWLVKFTKTDNLTFTMRMAKWVGEWTSEQLGLNKAVEETEEVLNDSIVATKEQAKVWVSGYAAMSAAVEAANKDIEEDTQETTVTMEDLWSSFHNVVDQSNIQMVDDSAASWNQMKDNWTLSMIDMIKATDEFIDGFEEGYKELDGYTQEELDKFTAEWDEGYKHVDENKNEMVEGFKQGMVDIVGHAGTMGGAMTDLVTDMRDGMTGAINEAVDMAVEGTLTIGKLGGIMQDMLSDSLSRFASRMIDKVLDIVIELIAANVASGSAAAGSQAAGWGGVAAALPAIFGYIGMAGGAILGARTVANQWAEGGWMSENPCGGVINCGSGVADDVFLGTTPGVNHWGMGGEFVVNKESTRKYKPLLEKINRGYDNGGEYGDGWDKPWKPVADMLATGGVASFGHGFWKGGPFGGLGEMATYFGTAIGASFAGKATNYALNKAGFYEDGGPISGYSNQGHFNVPGIPDDWFDGVGNWLDDLGDKFGGTWEWVSDGLSWTLNQIGGGLDAAWDGLKDIGAYAWDKIKDCVGGIIDWEDLADWLIKAIRLPLKQVSKDMVEPGVYHPDGIAMIGDILGGGWDLLKDFVKNIAMDIPGNILDCFETGTNYVPKDGAYYLHQGEAVVPAAQNNGGGGNNITFVNRGIITTSDIDTWFAERMDKMQSQKIGLQYQTVQTDQVGLSL